MTIALKCQVGLRSVKRILAEPVPTACEVAVNVRERAPRRGPPCKADEALVEWLRQELAADPTMMAPKLPRRIQSADDGPRVDKHASADEPRRRRRKARYQSWALWGNRRNSDAGTRSNIPNNLSFSTRVEPFGTGIA